MSNKKKLKFETKIILLILFFLIITLLNNYKDFFAYIIIFLILVQIIFSIKHKTFWELDLSKEQIKKIRELLLENNTNKEIMDIMNLDVDEQIIENFRTGKFDDLFDE